MDDFSPHPTDLLQDAVDGRLDAGTRATLDAHLASCASCRREFDALAWTKTQVARAGRAVEMPADLEARARAWLDEEDRVAGARRAADGAEVIRPRDRRKWAALAAAAALLIAAASWLLPGAPPDVPAAAAAHARAFRGGALLMEMTSADPQALEAHLRATRAPTTRVYDFGMMGHTLVGVRTDTLGNHPTALAAYRDAAGPSLLCEMYVGRVDELPSPDARRTNDGIDFLVYHEGEVTVVFWQEGTVVCVLTGFGDHEAIVALAFAKAIKV